MLQRAVRRSESAQRTCSIQGTELVVAWKLVCPTKRCRQESNQAIVIAIAGSSNSPTTINVVRVTWQQRSNGVNASLFATDSKWLLSCQIHGMDYERTLAGPGPWSTQTGPLAVERVLGTARRCCDR